MLALSTRPLELTNAANAQIPHKPKSLCDAIHNAQRAVRVGKSIERLQRAEKRLAHEIVVHFKSKGTI